MERKKSSLLRLKKRASESPALEEGPSKRYAPHQGFGPLASVSASTSQSLCSLLLKNVPTTLPPLPPSKLVQTSAAASDPDLQDSADEPEVEDRTYTWTPLPAPNIGLLTKQKPIISSLEQLCAPASEPANPTCSSMLPLSTFGEEHPSMGDEGDKHNMSYLISSSPGTNTVGGSNISENNRAGVFEVEEWDESNVDLFSGEELDLVWRNIDLTVDDSSSDSSDGLPAVNLGGNQELPGTSRNLHMTSKEQYKQKLPNRTHSSGSHMTLSSQVTRRDMQKQEDWSTFSGGPKNFPPKTAAGKNLSTGQNHGFTYCGQQLKLPTSTEPHQPDSECSFKPAKAKRDAPSSRDSSSAGRRRHESALRQPLVTESCPMCGTAFPHGYNQLDADHHIALCLERDLLLEDVVNMN